MDKTNSKHQEDNIVSYKLIHKQSQEVVDTIEVIKTENKAKEYFQNKKQLSKEIFEKLYEVEKDDGN